MPAKVQSALGSPGSGSFLTCLAAYSHPLVRAHAHTHLMAGSPARKHLPRRNGTFFLPHPKSPSNPLRTRGGSKKNYQSSPAHTKLRGTEIHTQPQPTNDLPTPVFILPLKSPVVSAKHLTKCNHPNKSVFSTDTATSIPKTGMAFYQSSGDFFLTSLF